jgi:hypothetical protein
MFFFFFVQTRKFGWTHNPASIGGRVSFGGG